MWLSLLQLVILDNKLHVRLNLKTKPPFKEPLGNPLKQTLERALRNFPRLPATTANGKRTCPEAIYGDHTVSVCDTGFVTHARSRGTLIYSFILRFMKVVGFSHVHLKHNFEFESWSLRNDLFHESKLDTEGDECVKCKYKGSVLHWCFDLGKMPRAARMNRMSSRVFLVMCLSQFFAWPIFKTRGPMAVYLFLLMSSHSFLILVIMITFNLEKNCVWRRNCKVFVTGSKSHLALLFYTEKWHVLSAPWK